MRRSSSKVELLNDINGDEACELVSGVDLIIGEGSGDSIRAYLLKALKNNNGAAILLLSDIFGFEDSLTRDFAYRVACSGYNVLMPDLFDGNPWKATGSPSGEINQWLSNLSPDRVAGVVNTSAKWLIDEFAAAGVPNKIGIIGFCYGGGRLIEALSTDADGYFGAGVCFYGTRMDPSLAHRIAAPVLYICGDDDPLCPVSTVREMAASRESSRAVVYQGRGHGFAHRPQTVEEDADAEDAFSVMRRWLQSLLVVSAE